MNISGLIDRLDDWVNPIVVKELRQAVKSRVIAVLLVAFLFVQLFIVGLTMQLREARSFGGDADWTAGRDLLPWIQTVLILALVLVVPAYGCIRMTAERSDQNVDLFFISTLKPHSIMAGKFFATVMLGVLILAACAPFMTFTYLLRGVDMTTILFILLIDVLALLAATIIMMLMATSPVGLVVKAVLIVMGYMFILLPATYMLVGVSWLFIYEGGELNDMGAFWWFMGSLTGAILVGVGLLFTYCVTMVSPSSSNRVLPIRVYVLAVWVLSVVAMFFVRYYATPRVLLMVLVLWTLSMSNILAWQLTISICERDQIGPRLRKQIPRNWLLRVPAFFLYTGSAGGLAFTVTLSATWLALVFFLEREVATLSASSGFYPVGDVLILGPLFLTIWLSDYCYSILAILTRVYLLSGQMRTGLTWLLRLLWMGIGSALPPSIAYMLFKDQLRSGMDHIWYKLPSPFISTAETVTNFPTGRVNWDYFEVNMWFLGIWSVLMTILMAPWFIRQIWDFSPRQQAAVMLPPEAATVAPVAEIIPVAPSPPGAVMARIEPPTESFQTG